MDVFPGKSCIMLGDRILVFQKEDSRGRGSWARTWAGLRLTVCSKVFLLLFFCLFCFYNK